jgi:alpha-tubulin suppressor-like RCC1 family protein
MAGVAAAALLALAGCRTVDAEGYPCSTKGACPPGYTCGGDTRCHAHVDAGTDGGTDGKKGTDGSQALDGSHSGDGKGCTAGTACPLANSCHVGRISCGDGGPACSDTGTFQSDGTSCGGRDGGGADGGTGMVCSSGDCVACAAGAACTLSGQPCKLGQTSCGTGVPVCMQAGNVKDGMGCGSGMICSGGACVACSDGTSCVPTNPCDQGKLSCTGGAPSCVDQQTTLMDGTTCGTDQVCSAGACIACNAGGACSLPATEPCRTGATSCNTGQPVCVENGNVTNGNTCGNGMVCDDGACVACATGSACTPTNPCHTGTLTCGAGTPTCVDSTTAVKDGTTCGTNEVCASGTCVVCTANQDCTPSNTTCKAGKTSCATGASVCMVSGNANDGSNCGTNQVCSGGSCVACAASTPCTPTTAPCHAGLLSCANGTPTCVDQLTNLQNGTVCGTNLVCNGGSCLGCVAGNPCTPNGNVCETGTTVCSSGSSVCMLTGNVAPGMGCGSNMVCNGGSCLTCSANTPCTPPNAPCHVGAQSCSSGAPVCVDQNTPATNGTTCGTNLACAGGSCSCNQGTSCTPPGMPCKTGTTSCTSGASVCNASGNANDGTTCAAGMVCSTGSCVPISGCVAGTPTLGCPCTSSGQTACNGAHQKLQLICTTVTGETGLAWETLGTCSSTQNCDQTVGACATIIPQCMGQSAGFAFCATGTIDVLQTCGTDLVSVTSQTCLGVCSTGVCQSPRCGDSKVESGEECDDGNTIPLDGCESTCIKSAVTKVVAGDGNSCALCRGGYVRCWGENTDGELGLGHTLPENNKSPYQSTDAAGNPGVVNLGGVAATDISAGYGFTCALLTGGTVRCWGKNDSGQLGLNNTTAMPTQVGAAINLGSGLTAASIAAGPTYACAVLSNGSVRCWGDNSDGQLGLGNAQAVLSGTVSLGAGVTASAVTAGVDNACAIVTGGAVRCWGDNTFGEFGLGSTAIPDSTGQAPSTYGNVILKTGRTAAALSAGGTFNCARLDDGEAECWGYNALGELGIGNTQSIGDDEVPGTAGIVAVGTPPVAGIAAGEAHTCALLGNAVGLKCWGDNAKGQLGQGDTTRRGNTGTTEPLEISAIRFPTGLTATSVSTGNSYTCALLSDGSVKCWGWNDRGQLGLGVVSGTQPSTPDYVGGASTETPDQIASVLIIAPH